MLFKLFVFGTLLYFAYRGLRNFLSPLLGNGRQASPVDPPTAKPAPPPYDPNRVEDIDFEEIRDGKKKRSSE